MSDSLPIRITADTSGVRDGVESAKAMLEGLEKTISSLHSTFSVLSGALSGGGGGMKALAGGASEGAAAMGELGGVAGAVIQVVMKLIEIGGKILEWGEKIGEAGERLEHMAQRADIATTQVQRLSAMTSILGDKLETGAEASGRLRTALDQAKSGAKDQADGFKQISVDTNKAYTDSELFMAAAKGIAALPGPERAAAATKIFGSVSADLVTVLSDVGQNAAALDAVTQKYAVDNADAAEKSASLGEAFKENKIAMNSVQDIMASTFAPVLELVVRGFNDLVAAGIRLFTQNKVVKAILDGLTVTFKGLVIAVGAIGLAVDVIFRAVVDVIMAAGGAIVGIIAGIIGWVHGLIDIFLTLKKVIEDVFTLKWGAISHDIQAGMKIVGHDFMQSGVNAANAFRAGLKMGSGQIKDAARDISGFLEWANGQDKAPIKLAKKLPKTDGQTPTAKGGGAGSGDTADEAQPIKPPPPDNWLKEQKEQLDKSLQLNATHDADALKQSRDYWQALANDQTQSQAHRLQAQQQFNQAKDKYDAQERAEAQADAKAQQALALETLKATFEAAKDGLEQKKALVDEDLKQGRISAAEAIKRKGQLEHDLFELAKDEVQKEAALQLTVLQAEHDAAETTYARRKELERQIVALKQRTGEQIATIDRKEANDAVVVQRQTADAVAAEWHKKIDPIAASFADMFHGMLTGATTLRQGLLRIGDQILKQWIDNAMKGLANWVVMELGKTKATEVGNGVRTASNALAASQSSAINAAAGLKDLTASAANAFGAVYASVSKIPYVGWLLAPPAAAAAFTAVLAYKSMFSAAGGWGNVPFDGAVTELHKNEMVLPASIATPLRAALGAGQTGGLLAAAGSGGVGDIHIHTMEPRTMQWWLKNGGGVEIKRYLNQALRSRLMPQPF